MSRTLAAFIDLAHCPVSYDFITQTVRAMYERDRLGCEGLHIVAVPDEGGLGGFSRHWGSHDEAAARWRLWNICVPSCPLARATVTVAESRRQAERLKAAADEHWWPSGKQHFMAPLVDAARRGERIPKLQATEAARRYVQQWLDGRRVVTLTVRQQSTDPDRNSNLPALDSFSQWLAKERNVSPLWVNESHIALANGQGYAELSPDLRLALYEQAAMNVIGANGPSELLKCSAAPYLIFGIALTAGWRDHYRQNFHLEPGEQLPWASAGQRMVYRPDALENLKEEFDSWASATRS